MVDEGDGAALRAAIWNMHGCGAVWIKSEHVHETFQGETQTPISRVKSPKIRQTLKIGIAARN